MIGAILLGLAFRALAQTIRDSRPGSLWPLMPCARARLPPMTTTYNPEDVERLVREAREDDARMQRTPWRRFGPWPQVTIYVDHGVEAQDDPDEPQHVCDVYISDQLKVPPPDRCVAEADAIARTRNNLRAMADQLEAARVRIAELEANLDAARRESSALRDRRGLPSDG